MKKIDLKVIRPANPQKTFSKWYAEIPDEDIKFLIGQSVSYTDADGKHRGLYQTRVMNDIPQLFYDRNVVENDLGLWAHFIWPSVTAESGNGHHLIVNSYDRARFTFGFYQLAAHTPNLNLILLFRDLLKLPTAQKFFPDLILKNGRVHRVEGGKTYSLEKAIKVHRPNGKIESQLVSFMTYLNPDTQNVNDREAYNAAKLMYWLVSEEEARRASEIVAFKIMLSKLKKYAKRYKLVGKDPRLAIWVSDIHHQGRGSVQSVKSALSQSNTSKQLNALSKIDIYSEKKPKGKFLSRRKSVKNSINTLAKEQRFEGVNLGDPELSFGSGVGV